MIHLIKKKRVIPIQAYGKLPLTNSFIAITKTKNALEWQSWLYRQNLDLTSDMKPFLFQNSYKSSFIIGLISKSCDGMAREFPFSIFIDWKKHWSKKKFIDTDIHDIWIELKNIQQANNSTFDFYQSLFQQEITVQPNRKEKKIINWVEINLDQKRYPIFFLN